MSGKDDTDLMLRGVAAAPPLRPPAAFHGTERFAVGRRLGEGSFGVVYEAIDQRNAGRVALKVLRRPTADWLYRFKREFRALADFSHPNVVQLYELSNAGEDWFFSMKLIEGEPFLDYVRRSPERLATALAQLARGLEALHAAGIVHRDVKPSNVLVTPDGSVVLLDFGLAADAQATEASALAGTPLYMAPEQAVQGAIGPAADWYAVGVMLYQALTGRPPFDGTVMEILAAKALGDPPSPRQIRPETPPALDALCASLLSRDPNARSGATAVLSAAEPLAVAAAPPASEHFVGRQAELARLVRTLDARAHGRAAVALVRGASGIGKSALLRRFADETRRRHPDAMLLTARCFERETIPFKALDGVIDALARALRRDPSYSELLPRDAAALARLFPVFETPERQATAPRGPEDPSAVRARGAGALRELLSRIADRRPLVILVDDLQWGDADSARLLADLARGPDAPLLAFVGAAREGEENSPFLQRFAELRAAATFHASVDVRDVMLAPLDANDARRLLAELTPAKNPAALEALVKEAAGSPFFLGELARSVSGANLLRLDEVIRKRCDALSPPARALLEAAAVAACPVTAEILQSATNAGDLAALVAELRGAHLLRAREEDGEQRLEAYHDRIRESVVAILDDEQRRALHRRLATAFEQRGDEERVAIHLREAGDTRRAAELTVLAAERALAATAFDHAARLYREALALFAESGALAPADQSKLERALAESLSSAGRCADAADAFLSAARLHEGIEAIDLKRRAAEELLNGGHLARGREVAASVLAELQLSMPSTPARAIASALALRARLWLRGGLERPLTPSKTSPEALLQIDTMWAIMSGLAFMDPVRSLPLAARHALLAVDLGDPFRMLRALAIEAVGATMRRGGAQSAALRYLERAQSLLPRCDRPDAELLLLLFRGIVDQFSGRFASSLRYLSDADALAQRLGIYAGLEGTAPRFIRSSGRFWMGHVAATLAEVPPSVRQFAERGNIFAWTIYSYHYAWALGLMGAIAEPEAIIKEVMARWSGVGVVLMHYWQLIADVHFGLVSGDPHRAWEAVEAAWPQIERHRLLVMPIHKVEASWLRGRAALSAAMGAKGPDAARLLQEVERAARRIDALQLDWGRGFSLSLRGGAALASGDNERAAGLLAEAEPHVEAVQFGTLLAAVREARARLIGGTAGETLRAAADAWRAAEGLPNLDAVCRVYLPTRV